MKIKFAVLMFLFLVLLVSGVNAPWESLSSGYAIWTNYHRVDVPPGALVTATAGTTEYPGSSAHDRFPDVTAVRFRWMAPNGSEWFSPLEPLTWDGSTYYDGWRVYTANDTRTVAIIGDWGVQAWFYDFDGQLRNQTGLEKIRATSFNVVPDIPVVGTAGAVTAMLLGLGLFWHKKKKQY